MIKTLDITQFTPTADKIIWDVRDADKYQQGHIEYATNQPLATINRQLIDETQGDIYVLCGGGTKAQKAAELIEQLDGGRTVIHLTGGTRAAVVHGMTIVRNTDDNQSGTKD
ncbi:rhodanese-like domain-containing protein [Moraxella cuniculi]|uniref:Molybdopterin biosynthesis protein MoeB n=1 Tax=Moraxella cuniculi TaxID=34061 RepID=A0A3S4QQX5_9GAMM|nr:rhodanese-like domain-containing protein [Moraxella cuniculi]VEG13929.1 molybdopterin biosynthesis protein MoeB [Moraxella cuniculi]